MTFNLGDIIIERWLPYGPQPERRTIVEEPPAAIAYAEPRNKIIIYEGVDPRVNRRFEKDGVVEGNPADYVARYGSSLLDSETLIRLARNAGVHEDLVKDVFGQSFKYTECIFSLALSSRHHLMQLQVIPIYVAVRVIMT